jgi:uncharacterized protein (DUF362 family)
MTDKTDRRKFIKHSLLGAASIAVAGCTSSWKLDNEDDPKESKDSKPLASANSSDLAQITGPKVEKEIDTAVRKLLEPLGGMQAFVKKGQKVLLKPNLGFARPPEQRATTSVGLVAAVAKMALEQRASKVVIADHGVDDTEEVIQMIGLRPALKGLDVEILAAGSDSRFVETKIPQGKELDEAEVLAVALECDVHIALPIAKSHSSAGFTGTLKGMMGLVATRKTFHWLHDLHHAIVDLNTIIKPDLVIMDGIEVMTNEGPQGPGELVRCDSLIAGSDAVAVDSAGVRLAPLFGRRVDPKQVRHLKLAQARGLGLIDLPSAKLHNFVL